MSSPRWSATVDPSLPGDGAGAAVVEIAEQSVHFTPWGRGGCNVLEGSGGAVRAIGTEGISLTVDLVGARPAAT